MLDLFDQLRSTPNQKSWLHR